MSETDFLGEHNKRCVGEKWKSTELSVHDTGHRL